MQITISVRNVIFVALIIFLIIAGLSTRNDIAYGCETVSRGWGCAFVKVDLTKPAKDADEEEDNAEAQQ